MTGLFGVLAQYWGPPPHGSSPDNAVDRGTDGVDGLTETEKAAMGRKKIADAIQKVNVGSVEDWLDHSDHPPMTVDLRL